MHDFKKFPELTKNQMLLYYFESPHKQIMEDFTARVVKVHDGDSIRVTCDFRDFDFPVRIIDIDAPEKGEEGWKESRDWLAAKILGEEVEVLINPNARISKWGRLLGEIMFRGMNIGQESVEMGYAVWWKEKAGEIPTLEKWLTY